MNKTGLTEDRICTVLKEKLYSMASNDSKNELKPLELEWVQPVNSTDGMISILENALFLLGYVQKNQCSKEYIDKIIQDKMKPVLNGLNNEYDFALASVILAICKEKTDFTDEKEMKACEIEVLGRFIESLEYGYKHFMDGNENEQKNISVSINNADEYMDTSRLEIGMVIPKGYTGLCKLADEKCFKSGSNQRKAQEKRFRRFIKWEKSEFNKRTIIITDIYDEPLPKDDKRKLGNNNIYLKYIETILLRYVYHKNSNDQVCYITKNQLWRILGMINKNYKKIPYSILTNEIEYSDVKKWELNNFYMRCNSKLNSILYTALKSLTDRSLIDWCTQIMIVVPDNEGKFAHHFPADDGEIKKILAVERKVLKDMGFENKSHVMCKMKMPQFYENVNNMLYELYGWERKYERIKLNFNKNDVKEALLQDEYRLQMLLLNDLIVSAIDKNAQVSVDKRMEKALKEYEEYTKDYFGKPPRLEEIDDIFTYPPYFVDIQRKLSQKFLSIRYAEEENCMKKNEISIDNDIEALFENLGLEQKGTI